MFPGVPRHTGFPIKNNRDAVFQAALRMIEFDKTDEAFPAILELFRGQLLYLFDNVVSVQKIM